MTFDKQKDLQEKKSERAKLSDAQDDLYKKIRKENRARTNTETLEYEERNSKIDLLDIEIETLERSVKKLHNEGERLTGNGDQKRAKQNNNVFTIYKPREREVSERSSVAEFVKRNYDFHEGVASLTPGEVIRAFIGGAKNDVEARALSEGTNSAGGFTVPIITSATLLDNVRAKSYVFQAGAQVVLLDSQQQTIAKITGDPTAAWVAENAAITASDPTFGGVQFAAKSLKATVKASLEVIQDSINIAQAIDTSLTGAFALEIDRVAIQGAGTSTEPKGIFNYTSPSVLSMGSNGASITSWDTLIDGIKAMLDNNCNVPNAAILAPRTWQTLMKLKDTTNQYIALPKTLQGLSFYDTSKVSITQTQGSSSAASSIYMGGFENLFYGQRLATTIYPTTESLGSNGQYSFVCVARGDFQPYREQAFGLIKGII